MGTLPTLTALLDDGTGAFPYDISSKVLADEGYSITRGRDDWIGAVTAGELTLKLDNSDGRFTSGSTIIASPSPITIDRKIRVKETVNGVTYTRFTGYVKSWPVSWPATVSTFSTVTLTATDAQARAERRPLRTLLEEEILVDDPVAYFPLQEPSTATIGYDLSGSNLFLSAGTVDNTGAPSSGTAPLWGQATGLVDGSTGVQMRNNGAGFPMHLRADGTDPADVSTLHAECVFTMALADITNTNLVSNASASQNDGHASLNLSSGASGQLQCFNVNVGSGGLADGKPHIVSVEASGTTFDAWIDGVKVVTGGATGRSTYPVGPIRVGAGDGLASGAVTITHVNVGPKLADARVLAHHQAALTQFAGEAGTARLTRLASYAGIPVGTLDTSLTNVAAEQTSGMFAQQALQDTADAEFGLVFIDGTGALKFHNRNRVAAKTSPDLALTAAQGVTPDVTAVLDDQRIVNYVEVTTATTGLTQLAQNATSQTTHGRYDASQTYLVQTDPEALDRANWTVGSLAEPTPRYGTLTLNLYAMSASLASTVLSALELNCWLRVTSMAAQNPGGTTVDLIVEGFSESGTGDTWQVACNVVSRSLFSPVWILGDTTYSVLGSTTRLYV